MKLTDIRLKDLTRKNLKAFVQGNTRLLRQKLAKKLGDTWGREFLELEDHLKEQVEYRMMICKETCLPEGNCRVCNCAVPGKMFASISCNEGVLFPPLKSKEEWEKFKIGENYYIMHKIFGEQKDEEE